MRSLAALILALVSLLTLCVQAAPNATRQALNRRLPEMSFTNTTLADSIDLLRDVTGANIHVNWRAMEILGVTRDTPVDLELREVPLRKVLGLLLAETGVGGELTFYVDEDVIEITTRELADQQMFTIVYPIDDLLMEVPDFEGPDLSLEDAASNSGGGRGGGGGGIFGGNDQGEDDEEVATTKIERAQQIIELITETIQPEVWRDNGGTASITYFNGSLIVTAPRSVHESLGGPFD